MKSLAEDVFLNGEFVTRDAARISAFDAGIQHGIGLFETMRAVMVGGEAFVHRMEAHLQRLAASASMLALTETLNTEALGQAVVMAAEKSGHERSRVRLTITGGDLNLLRVARGEGKRGFDPTLLIDVQPATRYPEPMYEQGVAVSLADTRCNPLDPTAPHKTLSYWWRLRELQIAAGKGAAEALVFQVSNHAAGGCVSNLLIVKDGVMRTPIARGEEPASHAGGTALPSPVLPGVVRSAVIETAMARGMTVEKRMLSIDDVLDADEVMLTNSSWGVLPVVRVESHQIGDARAGEVTLAMLDAIESESGMQGLRGSAHKSGSAG